MMWADRIGIGVCALVVLGGLIASAVDTTAANRKQRQDEYAAEVARCNQPWPEDDIFRKYAKMDCPPEAPTPIPDPPITEYVIRLIGLVALPTDMGSLADCRFYVWRPNAASYEEGVGVAAPNYLSREPQLII
jgi:hypothetical protein